MATAGLASLLTDLAPRERGAAPSEGQGCAIAAVAVLHVFNVLVAVMAAFSLSDKTRWEQLLIGSDVPGRVVAVGAIFAMSMAAASLTTLVDAQCYLGTSIALLGTTMALQFLATGLGAALSVLAALATDEFTFWLLMLSFTGSCLALGVQAGAILSTLIRQSPLATAIARVL